MSQFSQKPVRIKSRKTESYFKFTAQPLKTEAPKRRFKAEREVRASHGREKPRSSGFSFPLPSVATIAVIAGTVLIALTALKWEDIEIKAPEKYAFQPIGAEDTERQTLQYAATGISGIMPSFQLPEKPSSVPATDVAASSVPTTSSVPATASSVPVASSVPATEESHEALVTFEWQQYKVKKGDSVSGIAKKFDVSIGAIIASNEIRNAKSLQEGAVLRIPNIDGIPYSIKKGDNLSKISAAFNVPLEVILDVNDIKSDNIRAGETLFIPGARMNDIDLRMSLGELFIYPVQSKYVTSKFGMRKDPISGALNFHTGIDLRGNTGAAVMAAMEGTVAVVGESWLYGKHIIISHSNGYKTLYGHLNSFSVNQGEKVARGKKIGEVGNTGYSTGPHLHFSIYDKNGKLVNPLELLN
jgi:murein DD-endopeptidase MepM/ murein hydrolase activator NlpD